MNELHPTAVFVLELASRWHKGQTRKNSDVPYVTHPIEVARLLARDGFSWSMQCVALLHDVLEDCNITMVTMVMELVNLPGMTLAQATQITTMVWAMSSPDKTIGLTKKFNRAKRKEMMLGHFAGVSWEVAVVKIYDRYTNIMDMKGFADEFKKKYAEETLYLVDVLEERASFTPTARRFKVYELCQIIKTRCEEIVSE